MSIASVPNWLNTPVSGGGNIVPSNPIGTIIQYPLSTPPSGYLNCDGSAISRASYAELFAILGTTYGSGDASPQTVTSWTNVGSSLTLTFTSPLSNQYLKIGDIFSFSSGVSVYNNVVVTSASTTQVIGTINGSGTNSGSGGTATKLDPTTFNLPNTHSKTIRGYDGSTYTIGGSGGADTYSLTPANIASHKHDTTIVANGTGASSGGISTSAPPNSGTTLTTGIIYDNSNNIVTNAGSNGSAFSIVNSYLVLNYCIKY